MVDSRDQKAVKNQFANVSCAVFVLLLSDGIMCGLTGVTWLIQKLVLHGLVRWNSLGWITQHVRSPLCHATIGRHFLKERDRPGRLPLSLALLDGPWYAIGLGHTRFSLSSMAS